MSWFGRLRSALAARRPDDVWDTPQPGGGFHLWWQVPPVDGSVVACSVTLEVLRQPSVSKLYFWALQASFVDAAGTSYGAAHTGLQWNPRHPYHRAVNWGGYGQPSDVGSVLPGTDSPLPCEIGDPNTRDYLWQEGLPYRFTIRRGDVGWAADVALGDSAPVTIRELFAGGDRLSGFVVWSELFCRGSDPSTVVRWSDPSLVLASGRRVPVPAMTATFQGGPEWRRQNSWFDGMGVCQATGVTRTTRNRTVLPTRPS